MSIQRASREKVKRTPGPGALVAWLEILIATVITYTKNKRVSEITRCMTQGTLTRAQALLTPSKGGSRVNMALLERLHATFRERLEVLATGIDLISYVYLCGS